MTTTTAEEMLLTRIAEIDRQVAAVRTQRAASRRARRMILLLGIALLVAHAGALFVLYGRVISPQFGRELTAAAQAHVQANPLQYANELEELIDNTTETLAAALKARAEADLPLYIAAIDAEREAMLAELPPQIEDAVNARYADVLAAFEQALSERFPAAQDREVIEPVMDRLELLVKSLVRQHYVGPFTDQMQTMYGTWESFPVAAAPQPGEDPLTEQLIALTLEVMTDKLADSNDEARP